MYYFPLLIDMQLGKSMYVYKRTDLRFSVINRMNTLKGKSVLICLFFFFNFIYFILFLAALGLHCCAWAFSSCGEQGLLFVAVHRLLIAVGGFSCCGAWALGVQASVLWHAGPVVVAHGP